MNYVKKIKDAIEYVEDNLKESITFETIAQKVGVSPFYFHRIFTAIIGDSPTNYIRNRKLTCAAEDLYKTNKNIIDIAFEYGFENHETFSRAFKKFHGITPTLAKSNGHKLKRYHKAIVSLDVHSKGILAYRIESRTGMKISALVRNFNLDNKNEIPQFWDELDKKAILRAISNNYEKNLVGVCLGYMNDYEYKYGIGIIDKDIVMTDMEVIEIPKCDWAVFECKGQNSNDINILWKRIYTEFFADSKYRQCMDIDFELYNNENTEIWIPIEKE